MTPQPRNAGSLQNVEGAGEHMLPWSLQKGMQSHWYLDFNVAHFGTLASRNGGDNKLVLLKPPRL